VHLDAGPVPQPGGSAAQQASPSPYNAYGGFANPSHKPSQQNLDPRQADASQYGGSPAPPAQHGYGPQDQGYGAQPGYAGGYAEGYGQPPPQAGYYGGPGYGPPQGMHYGQPPPQGGGYGPGYGPGYGYSQQQQGAYYGGQRGYYDRRDDGICGALLAASACCCCLDMCMLF
jgi:hypothetical protein